jgi:hypothetical protein
MSIILRKGNKIPLRSNKGDNSLLRLSENYPITRDIQRAVGAANISQRKTQLTDTKGGHKMKNIFKISISWDLDNGRWIASVCDKQGKELKAIDTLEERMLWGEIISAMRTRFNMQLI